MESTPKSRTLITGGAGLIGSALAWGLNERGYDDIILADRLGTDEKWRNLPALRYADYIDGEDLITLLESNPNALGEVKTVLHLGACSATTEKDSDYLMRNNYHYTQRLCRWAMARDARFVYASSAATYGDGEHGMDDTDADLHRLRPLNMYGYSKHLFDCYAQREGFLDQIVGLKYFNVFGPNEDHKDNMRSVVHKATSEIQETGKVGLFKSYRPDYGHGEQMRDFLYIKDAVAMTLHLATAEKVGGLYNLGSGIAHTWKDLVRPIFTALEIDENIEFVEMPDTLREKYQYFTKANIDKLRSTGYDAPLTPLADSVIDYVKNYLIEDKRLGDQLG